MGKWITGIVVIALLTGSCQSAKKSLIADAIVPVTEADAKKGWELIQNNDCTTCHRINERAIGPAFMQVSRKYNTTEKNIQKLVQKIKEGGFGNWGQVPMTHHPDLEKEDIRKMVLFILSLRNQ